MTRTQRIVLDALSALGADDEGFYGAVSFTFQNGRLTLIRREQTMIPDLTEKRTFSEPRPD